MAITTGPQKQRQCRSSCRLTLGMGHTLAVFVLVCGTVSVASGRQVAADVRVALTSEWPVRSSAYYCCHFLYLALRLIMSKCLPTAAGNFNSSGDG
jgi:hypothetical protein